MPLSRNAVVVADAAPNDSDKTFTVPDGTLWRVVSLYAMLVTTATVGNRVLTVLITDADDNTLLRYVAGGNQVASFTVHYNLAPGHPNETGDPANNSVRLRAMVDGLSLPAGYKIRVYDSAAVDAAADDLTVRMIVEQGAG